MRTTVTLDDELLAKASDYSGVTERTALAGGRLAAMAGTMPGAWAPNEGDEPPR